MRNELADLILNAVRPRKPLVESADAFSALVKALEAARGYLLNAKIDLETGAPKRTAIGTIDGGLAVVDSALRLAKGEE